MIDTTLNAAQAGDAAEAPRIRSIETADLDWALAEGWRDFMSRRGDLIFAGLLYPLIGLAAALFATRTELLPLLFPMVAGVSILGPAAASGFYELARRREQGLDSGWVHFLDPLRGRSRAPLAALTAGLGALFVAWLLAAWSIYELTLAPLAPVGLDGFVAALFGTAEGWAMILFGNLAGLLFAVAVLAVSVVSFPMVVDRPVDPALAIRTSLRAFGANKGPMIGWGLRVAFLLAIGCLPLFIGLAVVLPVLGYSTWHLYTRLVER